MKIQFITEMTPVPDPLITYKSRIFMAGSCFTENIGKSLSDYRFNVHINPYGIMYNPLSLKRMFDELTGARSYSGDDLFFHEALWHSGAHHTSFSGPDKDEVLNSINSALKEGREALERADIVIITWGTAWVYFHDDTVLANCHRLPASGMIKRILTFEECRDAVCSAAAGFHGKTVIHTVSPVRHIRDGFTENSRSKALLISAVHEAVSSFPNNRYFPSYEIMIDSLRDYRFYGEDLVHPSAEAVEYIRDFFFDSFMTEDTLSTAGKVGQILKDLNHRPFRPRSEAARGFYRSLADRMKKMEGTGTGFAEEIKALSELIAEIP